MKNAGWVSLFVALVTIGAFLTACTQVNQNSPAPAPVNSPSATSTAPSPNPASPYDGAVDRLDCEILSGWALKKADPAGDTRVELYLDDKLIETAPARELRKDLTAWGSGRYGFRFQIPAAYKDAKPHRVNVRIAGTSHTLPLLGHVPKTLECKPS